MQTPTDYHYVTILFCPPCSVGHVGQLNHAWRRFVDLALQRLPSLTRRLITTGLLSGIRTIDSPKCHAIAPHNRTTNLHVLAEYRHFTGSDNNTTTTLCVLKHYTAQAVHINWTHLCQCSIPYLRGAWCETLSTGTPACIYLVVMCPHNQKFCPMCNILVHRHLRGVLPQHFGSKMLPDKIDEISLQLCARVRHMLHHVPYPLTMMQILCEAVPELWYAVCAPLVISTLNAKPRRDVLLSDVLHSIVTASYPISSKASSATNC